MITSYTATPTSTDKAKPPPSKDERFIKTLIAVCAPEGPHSNKGQAAQLRRCDNLATEYQGWEFLARFAIDLTNPWQRLPYVTIAAAVANARIQANGCLLLGAGIARCYQDGKDSAPATTRLRRLLASQDLEAVCRILRPCFSLIHSRVNEPLDYLKLLQQLKSFPYDQNRIKAQWAQSFYRSSENSSNNKEPS